jgi:hypothetical protein
MNPKYMASLKKGEQATESQWLPVQERLRLRR